MPTMTVNFLEFASGSPVPGTPTLTVPFSPGTGQGIVTAPQSVTVPGPGDPDADQTWVFEFWNVNGTLVTTPTAPLPEPGTDFTASAWYFGGGPGSHQNKVFTSAFSLNQNKVLAGETPIASVNVPGAWPGPPATVVATDNGPVTIEGATSIAGGGEFVKWLPVGLTVAGNALTAQKDEEAFPVAFYGIRVARRIAKSFDPVDAATVYVRGSDGNLWLEHAPFGTVPPKREKVDNISGADSRFSAVDDANVYVLDNDGNLFLDQGPFGPGRPQPQKVDANVAAFSVVDAQTVYVRGTDGKLWLEHAPFGTVIPPKREHVDSNVSDFLAVDADAVYVLGDDGKLWLEHGPFGTVPPRRDSVDINPNIIGFAAVDAATVYVLTKDTTSLTGDKLFLDSGPFPPSARPEVDANVLTGGSFNPVDAGTIFVIGSDGKLWLEHAPFGTVIPPKRENVDVGVFSCAAIDGSTVYVLGTDGNLWLEQGPFGSAQQRKQHVDANVFTS